MHNVKRKYDAQHPLLRILNSWTIVSIAWVLLLGWDWVLPNRLLASDFHSPRTDALGGAGHASPLLGDSIFLNPSFLPYIQTHSLSLNYLVFGNGRTDSPYGVIDYYGHNLNLSVLDGTPAPLFQAGVGYTVRDDSSLIHIGAAKGISKIISVGIGTKFIFPNDNSGSRYIDGTLSTTVLISSWLQASLIGDNLLNTAPHYGFLREYILGTKLNVMDITLLYADPHLFSDSSFGYEAGAEFPFFTDFFLRLGMFKNSTIPYQAQRGDGYGIGAGWIGPKISLDYAFSRAFAPISALSHNFAVSVFF